MDTNEARRRLAENPPQGDPTQVEPGGEALAKKAARLEANEAQLLTDTIANARMSTLQAAFRILGWPITFTVVETNDDA